MMVYIAELTTRNFTFTAAGETYAESVRALELTISAHQHQYDAWQGMTPPEVLQDNDYTIIALEAGRTGARDGQPINIQTTGDTDS